MCAGLCLPQRKALTACNRDVMELHKTSWSCLARTPIIPQQQHHACTGSVIKLILSGSKGIASLGVVQVRMELWVCSLGLMVCAAVGRGFWGLGMSRCHTSLRRVMLWIRLLTFCSMSVCLSRLSASLSPDCFKHRSVSAFSVVPGPPYVLHHVMFAARMYALNHPCMYEHTTVNIIRCGMPHSWHACTKSCVLLAYACLPACLPACLAVCLSG